MAQETPVVKPSDPNAPQDKKMGPIETLFVTGGLIAIAVVVILLVFGNPTLRICDLASYGIYTLMVFVVGIAITGFAISGSGWRRLGLIPGAIISIIGALATIAVFVSPRIAC